MHTHDPAILLTSCVTLSKLLNFSEPHFPICEVETVIVSSQGFLRTKLFLPEKPLESLLHCSTQQHLLLYPLLDKHPCVSTGRTSPRILLSAVHYSENLAATQHETRGP